MIKIDNPWNYKGLREAIIKFVIAVALVWAVQWLLGIFLTSTELYKTYLTIPADYVLLPYISRIIFFNAIIFGIVAFCINTYNELKGMPVFKFKVSNIMFLLFASLVIFIHYFLKYLINQNPGFFFHAPALWGLLKIVLSALAVLLLAMSVYGMNFTKYFATKFWKPILLFSGFTIVFFFLMLLVQNLWTFFSNIIAGSIYLIFTLLFDKVYYVPYEIAFTTREIGGPILGAEGFIASIGKPCSGIDSLLLFISLFAIIVVMDWKKIHKTKAGIVFIIGAIGMFVTNILRIFLLYLVGIYISEDFAIGVFHTNIGWILFIIYFFIFYSIGSRYMYRKDIDLNKNKNMQAPIPMEKAGDAAVRKIKKKSRKGKQ